jgi:hypothetical protein
VQADDDGYGTAQRIDFEFIASCTPLLKCTPHPGDRVGSIGPQMHVLVKRRNVPTHLFAALRLGPTVRH